MTAGDDLTLEALAEAADGAAADAIIELRAGGVSFILSRECRGRPRGSGWPTRADRVHRPQARRLPGRARTRGPAQVTAGRPRLVLVAGANGSGKSTLTRRWVSRLGPRLGPVFGPGSVARALDPAVPARAGIAAARIVLEEVRRRLEHRESFLVETTLADRNRHLGLVERASGRGFRIWLLYVGLEPAGLHLQRVAERVRLGGHDVPDVDVLRRRARSLANLPDTLRRVDRALVYDNSGSKLRLVASVESGVVRRVAAEGWWSAALVTVERGPS